MKKSGIYFSIRLLLIGISGIVLAGCGSTRPMALTKKTKSLETKTESVALLTLRVSNSYKPTYQPNVIRWIEIQPSGKTSDETRIKPADPFREQKDEFNEFLISFRLAPGKYSLQRVYGYYRGIFIGGRYIFPINAHFELKPDSVIYLGHVDMVNRERRDDSEKRSGPLLPLVDQSVTGFSGGTFDITISDRYEEDLAIFKEKFPVMAEKQVDKAILVKEEIAK